MANLAMAAVLVLVLVAACVLSNPAPAPACGFEGFAGACQPIAGMPTRPVGNYCVTGTKQPFDTNARTLLGKTPNTPGIGACGAVCDRTPGCTTFAFDPASQTCYTGKWKSASSGLRAWNNSSVANFVGEKQGLPASQRLPSNLRV